MPVSLANAWASRSRRAPITRRSSTLGRPSPAGLLVHHPMVWATGAALGAAAVVSAGALVTFVAFLGAIGLGCAAAGTRPIRGWLESSARGAVRTARRDGREARLEEAGVPKQGLAAATLLLDQISATGSPLATHPELEEMLDRYVELEITAKRCERLLADARRARAVPGGSETRARISDRAAAVQRACDARLASARDELASILELLQLLVQRSTLDATEVQGDPVGERMSLVLVDDPDSTSRPSAVELQREREATRDRAKVLRR